MRGETMKDKSKKSTYSTIFGVDPFKTAFEWVLRLDKLAEFAFFQNRTSKLRLSDAVCA